jgi:hypothetical protein
MRRTTPVTAFHIDFYDAMRRNYRGKEWLQPLRVDGPVGALSSLLLGWCSSWQRAPQACFSFVAGNKRPCAPTDWSTRGLTN